VRRMRRHPSMSHRKKIVDIRGMRPREP
jgi:hypothetical protein